jgi:ABC-type glycerol-3-phosphate transport system substrate-binding protein
MCRLIFASALGALMLCAGCAGAPSSSAGSGGSITMYGTVDQGVTVHN